LLATSCVSKLFIYASCFFKISAKEGPLPQDFAGEGATAAIISESVFEVLDLSSALEPSVLIVPVLLVSSNFCVESEDRENLSK
jgi:hypothetical protein